MTAPEGTPNAVPRPATTAQRLYEGLRRLSHRLAEMKTDIELPTFDIELPTWDVELPTWDVEIPTFELSRPPRESKGSPPSP